MIGQGAFGPVYKAQMPTGETVAVKVLATNSKQGEKEFQTEAVPPVVHRDIKSANILLDHSMRARAAINAEGRVGWEEIADPRLDGVFDISELNDVAILAYKCINRLSKKRPSMRVVVQALSQILKTSHKKHHSRRWLPITVEEESLDIEPSEHQSSVSGHQREESIDSVSDLPDV
ncbi:hypothetical protein BHE74_00009676 [Ensete ventricosum]|uniref:Uncharacterized protein n=1 Tax=Ensete ventricosum TaxID=4639 RepID=A0A427AL71_ENSVE|nr:hypothetical protein B296_00027603 [Ensete ventricosum]RWW24809.1 hypothetical protein GW17_00010881 [Ensete ventricosum]RWW81890.1 hypothetical protein BHE74_00009676 [Ensete ventricosum]